MARSPLETKVEIKINLAACLWPVAWMIVMLFT